MKMENFYSIGMDTTLYPTSSTSSSFWTREENKQFERALAIYDIETPDRWLRVAEMIPGKSVYDVYKQYRDLEDDVSDIEAGLVPVPGYLTPSFTLEWVDNRGFDGFKKGSFAAKASDQERRKGVLWTEDEHRRFLLGLIKHGKGDWKNISQNFVVSKTPTQVASHAQKYYNRQNSEVKEKRRPSIHDMTTVNLDTKPTSLNHSSTMRPQQPKPTSTQKVVRNWNEHNNERFMVFNAANGNMFVPSPYEIESYGFKTQHQNLYAVGQHESMFTVARVRNCQL